MDAANSAVIVIRDGKGQLAGRPIAGDDETLIAAGEGLRTAVWAVEGEIYQVRNRSNQDPVNVPIKVTNPLTSLLPLSESGNGYPRSGNLRGVRDDGGAAVLGA